MDGPRFPFESIGHFTDTGLSQINAYQRNLLSLPDAQMENALIELFADGPNAHLSADDLAAELAATAPPHVLPPVVDFGMFQAAQQQPLLRAESSSLPERSRPVSAARPASRPESKLAKPLLHTQGSVLRLYRLTSSCGGTDTQTRPQQRVDS